MFMENIHGLEDNIIKVPSLLNLIYKSNAVQMKIPVNFLLCVWNLTSLFKYYYGRPKKKTPRKNKQKKKKS